MKQNVIFIANDIKEKIKCHRYHQRHKLQADTILKDLESVKGKTDPKLIKLSDEYAKDVFGWSGYAPWLHVYSSMAESFREGWIPDNYYGKVVVPIMKGDYGKVSDLKPLTKRLFKSNVFPDIAYYVSGMFFSNNYEVLSENKMKEYLFKNANVVVFKVDNSLQGRGVFMFEKSTFKTMDVRLLGNGVFQYYIEQHPFFDEFMPNSVATIRITTVLDNTGNTTVRACYLRIGRSADLNVKSASHIRVPIDLKTGELNANGYLPSWLSIDRHPDSNVVFSKKKVPCFNECLALALDLHKTLPYARCIGWDMIIDKNSVIKVMEWNGDHNDIKFSEATQGPCFSDLGWEKLSH